MSILSQGKYELGKGVNDGKYDATLERLLATADVIDDIPFANLNEILAWKHARGLEKDICDIRLIEASLSK